MGLKERIEMMYTLDQLSDDQYATVISQIFARDRTSTNQLLAGYFATNNNAALATKIKKIAKSKLQSQDSDEEPAAQTAITDPYILSNIALFLPNRQIVRLELLSRRSFISLRNYPAIHALTHHDIHCYLTYCKHHSMMIDMGRFRNVRYLDVFDSNITALLDCGSHPIFKKVETLECWHFLDMLSRVPSLCDMSEIKSLSLSCFSGYGNAITSTQAKDLMALILSCSNVKTLILKDLNTSGIECIWTPKVIRESLPELRVLELRACAHSEIVETLFEAISSQMHSFHLCEREDGNVMLSALLQRCPDLRNLKELCWSVCDGADFTDGVGKLIGSQINNLQKLHFENEETDDVEVTLTKEAKRNLVCLFKRNWSQIDLSDNGSQVAHDLVCCLKKGLLQREAAGNLCVVLPTFHDTPAEMDMLDVVGIVKMGKADEFAVMRWNEPDKDIFNDVSGSVTIDNTRAYTCCLSANYAATSWKYSCENCQWNHRKIADSL